MTSFSPAAATTPKRPEVNPDDEDPRCRRTTSPIRFATAGALTLLIGMVPFGVVVVVTASTLAITGPGRHGASGLAGESPCPANGGRRGGDRRRGPIASCRRRNSAGHHLRSARR